MVLVVVDRGCQLDTLRKRKLQLRNSLSCWPVGMPVRAFFFCRKAQPTVGNAIPVHIGIRKVTEHASETEPVGSISS